MPARNEVPARNAMRRPLHDLMNDIADRIIEISKDNRKHYVSIRIQ